MTGNSKWKGLAFGAGVLLVSMALVTSAYYALQKPVTIRVDGIEIQTSILFQGTVAEILEQEEIRLGENDIIEPELATSIEKNLEIVITRAFPVFVKADGKIEVIETVPVTESGDGSLTH